MLVKQILKTQEFNATTIADIVIRRIYASNIKTVDEKTRLHVVTEVQAVLDELVARAIIG